MSLCGAWLYSLNETLPVMKQSAYRSIFSIITYKQLTKIQAFCHKSNSFDSKLGSLSGRNTRIWMYTEMENHNLEIIPSLRFSNLAQIFQIKGGDLQLMVFIFRTQSYFWITTWWRPEFWGRNKLPFNKIVLQRLYWLRLKILIDTMKPSIIGCDWKYW